DRADPNSPSHHVLPAVMTSEELSLWVNAAAHCPRRATGAVRSLRALRGPWSRCTRTDVRHTCGAFGGSASQTRRHLRDRLTAVPEPERSDATVRRRHGLDHGSGD